MIKQLRRGVPDGAKPQRQSSDAGAYVLVSEHTRRIAHELDDRHRDWIVRREQDPIAESLDVSPLELNPNHVDWLTDFANAERRYEEVYQRRIHIERRLGESKSTKTALVRRYGLDAYLKHVESLRGELAYSVVLQNRLRTTVKHLRIFMTDSSKRDGVLKTRGDIATLLAELMGVVSIALKCNDIEVIRQGLGGDDGALKNRIKAALSESMFETLRDDVNARIVMDGFMAARWELEDPVDLSSNGL